MISENLKQLLKNKTVTLWGGGEYQELLNPNHFNVFTNQHFKGFERFCNGIYTSACEPPPQYNEQLKPRFVFASLEGPELEHWSSAYAYLEREFYIFSTLRKEHATGWLNHQAQFAWQLGTSPLTGIFAAWDLLQYPIKSLRLCGFDFYCCDDKLSIPTKRGPHLLLPQLRWLVSTALHDERLILTGPIRNILTSIQELSE